MQKRTARTIIKFEPDANLRKAWLIMWASVTVLFFVIPICLLLLLMPSESAQAQSWYLAATIYSLIIIPFNICFVIWLVLYFKSLKYEITETHVQISSGVIWRKIKEFPLLMINDVITVQGPFERLFSLGHLRLKVGNGHTDSCRQGILRGLPDYLSKRQEILGRITQLKNLHEIIQQREETRSTLENLLTGILNEIRELRADIKKPKRKSA